MGMPAQINTLRVFTFFSDPGHAWLAVPMGYLRLLGIEGKISSCSYISASRKTAYLEEDCDAGVFVNAWRNRFGCRPMMRGRYAQNESKIRQHASYTARQAQPLKVYRMVCENGLILGNRTQRVTHSI